MIVVLILLAGVASAADPLVCSLHGQGHVLMTDGSTRHTLTGSGLADIFSTTGLSVQCDINQTSSAQSLISSCRFLISSTTSPCSVDIVHGNQPGQVSIWGQTLPVTALEEFVSANVDSALGLACHAVDDDTITIEITQRDAERFILIESSLHSLTITTSNVTSCSGAFGTCQGPQTAPRAEAIASMPFRAIQPQRRCGASSASAPIASPYPSVSPYAEVAAAVPIAAFASPETRNAVIADCSDHDQARLLADSLFSGFVEACADDIALGASPAVAKSNMDTFVKVIENRQKVEMAAEALRRNPAAIICAACMSVEWDNPVNTTSVLDASKLISSSGSSQRAKSHSMYKKPSPAHNLYEKRTGAPQEMGFPKPTSMPASSQLQMMTSQPQMMTSQPQMMTSHPASTELSSSPATSLPQMMTSHPASTELSSSPATSLPQMMTSRPATIEPKTSSSPQAVLANSTQPQSSSAMPASSEPMPTHKPLYEHGFKPSDETALPSWKMTPSPSFPFPAAPTGYEMPTSSPSSAEAMPATSQPMTSSPGPDMLHPTSAPTMGYNALYPTSMPTTSPGNSTAPSFTQHQGPFSSMPTTAPANSTAPSSAMPTTSPGNSTAPWSSEPLSSMPTTSPAISTAPSSTQPQPNSTSSPTPSPSGNGTLPMQTSTTTAPTPVPTGNLTMGHMTPSSSPTSSPSSPAASTPVPPPSPTSSPSAAGFTPVPPPSPTPAPTSSSVAAATSTAQPTTAAPTTIGNTTSSPSPAPTGQLAAATTPPTALPSVPALTSSPNSLMPSSTPINPAVPMTSTPNSTTAAVTPTPAPTTANSSNVSSPTTGPLTSAPTASNVSAASVPSTPPRSSTSPPLPTSSLVYNLSSPWVPSYSPVNYTAVPTPAPTTSNGTKALGAATVPDRPSSNSTRPPITALPITMPFILPSTAPRAVVAATIVPSTTAPLTGRGSVYGCHCNMSTEALKESLDKVQYAFDSYLIEALTKSVLDGEDHNLLTVIACGLGGSNNVNIRALSITETEATNMCRLCELGSANNDQRSMTSAPSVYSRRTRNLSPTSTMSPTVISSMPGMSTPINNPSPATLAGNGIYPNRDGFGVPATPAGNGIYPNRDGFGVKPFAISSRAQALAFAA